MQQPNAPHRVVDATSDGPPHVAYVKVFAYDGDGNLTHEGWAAPATATSAAAWAIRKNTYTGSNLTKIEWANGFVTFDNVWDDRATLTYN